MAMSLHGCRFFIARVPAGRYGKGGEQSVCHMRNAMELTCLRGLRT